MPRIAPRGTAAAAFATLLLWAASARAAQADPSAAAWDGACYVGFADHVAHLAGPDAIDCGLHPAGETAGHASARRCMRRALAAGRIYKVGEIGAGAPAESCRVVVEGRDALPVYLWYFRDHPRWSPGTGRLWVQRCHDVLVPDRREDRRLFVVDDCVDAHALLPHVFPMSTDGAPAESSVSVRARSP